MDTSPLPTPSRWVRWAAALTLRPVLIVLALCVLVALLLNPAFVTPFPIVLGRTVFVGITLLLVFNAAGHWRLGWLPRWVAQVLAVVLCAPLATFAIYLLRVDGDVAALFEHEGLVSGFVLISISGLVIGLAMALGALYRERDAQARAQGLQFALEKSTLERQALDARLRLLHAQIEPHFLFNTLANVQALVESGSERAAPVLRHLIAYLRAAMPSLHDGDATLGVEMQRVRAYLELMHLRMPDRLRFRLAVEPGLEGLRFPAMALLTLVENAVHHGIDPNEDGGEIEVGARHDDVAGGARVRVWVTDSGVGMAETAAPGTGLVNLRERMQAFYGAGAQLELIEVQPHGLRAELVFDAAGATNAAHSGS